MPCNSEHMCPTAREAESMRVLTLLSEVTGSPRPKGIYGDPANLDRDTERLCSWCREHPEQVPWMSLELQIWWRDHRAHDARQGRA